MLYLKHYAWLLKVFLHQNLCFDSLFHELFVFCQIASNEIKQDVVIQKMVVVVSVLWLL